MERYLKNFDRCLEREIPFCQAKCPFHMEIFNFIEKAARGANKAAFKVYRNAVGYPRIAGRLCTEPCKEVCPRSDFGGAIEMGLLERSVTEHTQDLSPIDYNIPMKKERVAIIGAGISAMGALLRLSTKKYHVELFEKSDRLGGNLWNIMPSELFLEEFKEQLAHQTYEINFNCELTSTTQLEKLAEEKGFHAVYVATGKDGNDFGLIDEIGEAGDPFCRKKEGVGYFAGGELLGAAPVDALAAGLAIGTVIDNYLKTGTLYYPDNTMDSRMCREMADIRDHKAAVPATGTADGMAPIYTEEELTEESGRCIKCQCSICKNNCDLIEYTGKWPVRMRDEIVATTLEGKSELKATPAKRLMSLCNQCGICTETCPEDIDLDGLFMAGRKKMHRQGKAPWAFHDFFLKDMDFSNSQYGAVVKGLPKTCGYAFFPGCQLGASEPGLVAETYGFLRHAMQDVGIMLMCCGVPAEWAGDYEKHEEELERVRVAWHELGEPTLILACPTCEKKFREHLQEIPVISLYEKMAEICEKTQGTRGDIADSEKPIKIGTKSISAEKLPKAVTIFDACSSRGNERMQKSVRKLAEYLKISVENEKTDLPRCCGFGGHGEIADPKYREFLVEKRIGESHRPYITYCINCRDNFKEAGKEAYHMLEIFFKTVQSEKMPTVTQRRDNRVELKRNLLKRFWGEEMDKELLSSRVLPLKIHMSVETEEKISKERILMESIASAIEFCERTGRTVYNEAEDIYSGYQEIGFMTLWIHYRKSGSDEYELINAYTHRMRIELEAVWNGEKCKIDV